MGPLSGKQQREWAKHVAKEQRETAKMEAEESRKQELHEIKLQEAAAKANQGIGHKEELHGLKVKELGGPLSKSRINKQKLGLPSMNPLAGTEVFKQGQHMLSRGTDTVPAMLTPGEAVIPEAAAQNPKNKPIIKQMVAEGRAANRAKGYSNGTEEVPNISSDYYHTDSPATMSNGTTSVQYYENGVTGAQPRPVHIQELNPDSSWTDEVPVNSAYVQPTISDGVQVAAVQTPNEEAVYDALGNVVGSAPIMRDATAKETRAIAEEHKSNIPNPYTYGNERAAAIAGTVPKEQPKPVVVNEVSPTKEVPKPVVFTTPSDEDAWVVAHESSGRTDAKNPNSSASGLYQMTNNAWVDAIKANPSLSKVDRTTAEGQQAGRDAYKSVLANQLKAKGIEPTEEAIRKAWVVGADGYANILNGDPNAPLSINPNHIAINRNLQGKTNGEFIADPNPYSIKGKGYVPEPRMQASAKDPEQVKLAKAYDTFKKGGPLPKDAPAEIADRDARIAEFSKAVNSDEEVNKRIDQMVKDKTSTPETIKSKLASFFQQIYGPSGLFNERELLRFSLLAAGSKILGYNTMQSVRFAGRDTLAAADKRYNAEAAARIESAKNERELLERLDQDYRTALGGNVPPEVRKAAMTAWGSTRTADQKRRVIELIRANTDHNTGEGSKPTAPQNGYIDGKPVQYRSYKGENQIVDASTGEWKPTRQTIITETQHHQNRNDMLSATADRITPLLMNTYGKGNKDYTHGHATAEAKGHAQALALLQDELGGKVDSVAFAKMAENTMRSAIDSAKATGTQLTEEGIRKAFYGNAVIEGRMGTNRTLYMTDDKKNPLPSAPYQVVLGNFLEEQKKSKGLNAGEAANALERAWAALPKDQQKKYTDMSKGAPGSTPMLFWLYKTGGR